MIHEGYIIGSGTTWANTPDSDGDGLLDGTEILGLGTDPLFRDTDHDDISNSDEPRVVFRHKKLKPLEGIAALSFR